MSDHKRTNALDTAPNEAPKIGKPKFTPGPWTVPTDNQEAVISKRQHYVADCRKCVDWLPPSERRANAHLIAAAPELYGALTELVRCVRGGDETAGFSMDDALAEADDALAKVRTS